MTLDEIIYANSNDRIPNDMVDTIKDIAKSYALHIAREAVEEERGRAERPDVVMGIDRLYGAIIRNIDKPEEES